MAPRVSAHSCLTAKSNVLRPLHIETTLLPGRLPNGPKLHDLIVALLLTIRAGGVGYIAVGHRAGCTVLLLVIVVVISAIVPVHRSLHAFSLRRNATVSNLSWPRRRRMSPGV